MPRRSSGPKLWWDKARKTWVIVDRKHKQRTGFGADEDRRAHEELAKYIANQRAPQLNPDPAIADVIEAYRSERVEGLPSEVSVTRDLKRLTKWWGDKTTSAITAKAVKQYTAHRTSAICCRRELKFLVTALRHWHHHYNPIRIPPVAVPERSLPRQRWMTVTEGALFLRHAKRTPHLARFFIIGWYTGSRASVIASLDWSQFDLDAGVLFRQRAGTVQTKKRAPPVRLGRRLLGHLRRWHAADGGRGPVIHYKGVRVDRPAKAWNKTREAVGLPDVHPHVLRHTRATNLMRQGADPWAAANSLGMSLTILQSTYGHHHPNWQHEVAETR